MSIPWAAIGIALAAVASLATVAFGVWFHYHPRRPGGPWIVRPVENSAYEVENNTGRMALDVSFEPPAQLLKITGPFDELAPGATVYPFTAGEAFDRPLRLTVHWKAGRKRRSYVAHVPPSCAPIQTLGGLLHVTSEE
jgi:hypothetical protein